MSDFYYGKRVLVTGHTGFKGSWLCHILKSRGAIVTGFALKPPTEPSLFKIARVGEDMNSVVGDIRDFDALRAVFKASKPEIVFHLAAQPIVRESYKNPRYTYETNVIGTVNVLECIRLCGSVRSFVNVTTDKVYFNREWPWGYRENDPLDGFDPYSNSKSCSELVTGSYVRSYFSGSDTAVSTVRAGNVIGGGDFASDRIIPDCVRAALENKSVVVRNPSSVRPYQHVLEALYAYLLIAERQYFEPEYAGSYNVGPEESDCVTTGELVQLFCDKWGGLSWISRQEGGGHEAGFLKLDCSKIKQTFGWRPLWNIETAVEKAVEWYRCWQGGGDIQGLMDEQALEYAENMSVGVKGEVMCLRV